jgi:cytochrome c oxidase subunit 4
LPPPGEGWKVLSYTLIGVAVSFGIFAFARMMARPPPATMTKEYQEMTNEYLKVRISLTEHFPYEMLFLELGRV